MMVWGAILIPIITAVILFYNFKHRTKWWEFLIPFAASVVFIFIAKFTVEKVGTTDTEYWGGWAVNVVYLEDWNEYIHQTCTRSYTDSSGNTQTETYDCSYVQYHPPQWFVMDSNGIRVNITQKEYGNLRNKLGNQVFIDLHRNYHTDDGDKYQCSFNYKTDPPEKLIPVTTVHRYENRVQAATSLYDFKDVSDEEKKKYGIKEYPKPDQYYCSSIIGGNYPSVRRKLDYFNARYGAMKQIRVWLLIFRDQPKDAGLLQEQYWKGANKNEFVICVGLDKQNNFQWGHVFSWTPIKETVFSTRDWMYENLDKEKIGPEDLENFVDYTTGILLERFKRMEFAEFDYLKVKPPWWAVLIVYILVTVLNVGISYWVIINEHHDEPFSTKFRSRYRRKYF